MVNCEKTVLKFLQFVLILGVSDIMGGGGIVGKIFGSGPRGHEFEFYFQHTFKFTAFD